MSGNRYALVTAAKDERRFVGQTIESILAQTVRPSQWVLVDDGSTDGTRELIGSFAREHAFMRLADKPPERSRSFGSHARAFNFGCSLLELDEYDFIGNLDADVSFAADYYERVLGQFHDNHRLGIGGGVIYESHRGEFALRPGARWYSVPGAVQLFRQQCFEAAKPYLELPLGGYDSLAAVMARMNGWEVVAFPDLVVHHHRPTSSALGKDVMSIRFREGRRDYALGNCLPYELAKLARRMTQTPVLVGSVALLLGYCREVLRGEAVMIPEDVKRYQRGEQLGRLMHTLGLLFGGREGEGGRMSQDGHTTN